MCQYFRAGVTFRFHLLVTVNMCKCKVVIVELNFRATPASPFASNPYTQSPSTHPSMLAPILINLCDVRLRWQEKKRMCEISCTSDNTDQLPLEEWVRCFKVNPNKESSREPWPENRGPSLCNVHKKQTGQKNFTT